MRYLCIKECCFRNRLWKPGETLAPLKDEAVPNHFKAIEDNVKIVKNANNEPRTLKELQKEENKDADKLIYEKMTKDDLIAKATELELSEKKDLCKLTKQEIIGLIVNKEHKIDNDIFD